MRILLSTIGLISLPAAVVACAHLLGPRTPSSVYVDAGTVKLVDAGIEESDAQPDAGPESCPAPKTVHRTRIVERPVLCVGDGPTLVPVTTVECADGYLCLDHKNQAADLANRLAWRSWLKKAKECEDRAVSNAKK